MTVPPQTPLRAVVTGGTGFIGAALVARILAEGGAAAVLVRRNSPNLGRLRPHPSLHLVEGDLVDPASFAPTLEGFAPTVFYHLGWLGVGNAFRNDPAQVANIRITLDMVELAARLGCARWVGTGSQAEYGPVNRKVDETAPLLPTNLYGASKVAAWALARVAGDLRGMSMAWARVFSTYGPGDAAGWMLVDVIRQLLEGRRPALTLGEQVWDYLYVDDAALALYRLGLAEPVQGAYNLGSGQARSIRSIVELARDLIDHTLPLGFGEVPYRPDQVMHLEADVSKLTLHTGWQPTTSLEQGIGKLIDDLRPEKGNHANGQ